MSPNPHLREASERQMEHTGMKLSEKLKAKVERDLGVEVDDGPNRIWGAKGAAHRWEVTLSSGIMLTSEDTMADSLRSPKLHIIRDGIHEYITVS